MTNNKNIISKKWEMNFIVSGLENLIFIYNSKLVKNKIYEQKKILLKKRELLQKKEKKLNEIKTKIENLNSIINKNSNILKSISKSLQQGVLTPDILKKMQKTSAHSLELESIRNFDFDISQSLESEIKTIQYDIGLSKNLLLDLNSKLTYFKEASSVLYDAKYVQTPGAIVIQQHF